ncbi:ABC transporter permease [Thermomonospora umbrina]|uniref:Transport permease protein n=1 Tax=Thermomonospora umbrina TaxID=111806 RepID=A0A3D9T811_9ACTN|nr:ABC transporter permease [Thermomonospora umbrina]REF00815.1 ABC transporter DrrB family efflux protein [Thermomonospora umbrina]
MTTTTAPTAPTGGRLRWWLTDSWNMTRRELARLARRPAQVALGLGFGVMMLVMFAYFIGGGMVVAGGGDYKEFLVPGMLVLTMAFGLEATMTAVTQDLQKGVLDRFRSMPMAPSTVLVGRSVADMLESVVALLFMIGAGLLIGWRWHGSYTSALAAVGLLFLLRFAMLWCGIWLGLIVGRPELVMAVQILVWPIAFSSGVFASPESMPGWLGALAEWNPMTASATAVRDLFGNPGVTGESWAAEHAVLLAVVWPLALLAVVFPMAAARFRGLSR